MCEKNQFKVYDNGEPIYLDGLRCQFSVDDANRNAIAYVCEKEIADRIAQALNSSLLLEKTLADVQAGIPARDAEIETLRKENAELREQLEAIGAGGVNGKLMPGAVSAEPVEKHFAGEEHVAIPKGLIGAACSAIEHKRTGEKVLAELRRYTFGDLSAPVASQAQIEDDSIALDRLADYIADTWPMCKKYGIEEICQRLHAMWPGEFMPASQVDKSTETQGNPVDESPNLLAAQQPVSGADEEAQTYDSEKRCEAYYRNERPFVAEGMDYRLWQAAWMAAQFDLFRHGSARAALAQQDAGKVDALERAVAGLKRYTYGYKDDGFGGPRYLGTIESPEGRLLIRDDVLSAIDAARKEQA